MNNKVATACIFRQKWWVDVLSEDSASGEILIELNSGQSISLPYVIKKQFGFKILTMPSLTQSAGPLILGVNSSSKKRQTIENKLYNLLFEKLPPHDAFNQNFHFSITNWLPWYWKDYEQSTRYTYRLNDLSNLDEVYANFQPKVRTDIKKSQSRFSVKIHSDYDIERFLDINEMTFLRQNITLPYKRELVRKLDKECIKRNCRKILFAEDAEGKIHAAAYIVWDKHTTYYLMGGGDPELRNSGATSAVMWEAIRYASSINTSFDFEGSMIEPVERFVRGFGAKQVPYFHVWKFNSKLMYSLYQLKLIYSKILR